MVARRMLVSDNNFNEFTRIIDYSVSPQNDGDALLVERGLVLAAAHLQTHDQLLPGAVEIHRHQHLIFRQCLVCHLLPPHVHRWEGLADVLLLADGRDDVVLVPVAPFDPHACHQQAL